MSLLKALALAFWLFCVGSCCMFLYNDHVATPSQPSTSSGASSSNCPLGYAEGGPPGQESLSQKEKQTGGGESCPLGFGGDGSPSPPINPPIPEQTKRDLQFEAAHRTRCNELVHSENNAAALGCFAAEVANRKKLAGLVHLDTADSHERLGMILHTMKRHKVALNRFSEALGALPLGEKAITARLLTKLARVHKDLNQTPESMGKYMLALSQYEEAELTHTQDYAAANMEYATVAAQAVQTGTKAELTKAEPTIEAIRDRFESARRIYTSLFGADHPAAVAAAVAAKEL